MKKNMFGIGVIIAMLLCTTAVLGTETRFEWDGSGSIQGKVTKDNSEARFEGIGNAIEGEFEADDDNYERIEITNMRGEYQNGRYDVYQENDLKSGSSSYLHVWSDGFGSGFVDMKTDEWRTGNSLKANGYNGHSWSWSGTDEQVIGASDGSYDLGLYAGRDDDNDGTYDAFYGLNVWGDEEAGIGTDRAGSNTVLSASGISGDLIIRGEGNSGWSQQFQNAGHFEGEFEWN